MNWKLDFISEKDFKTHVTQTIKAYGSKLESYDLNKFNSNLIDPIKLIFDKTVYKLNWEEIVENEIFRQRDKSSNNDIGYFHQNIFQYIENCSVPPTGFDVVLDKPTKILINNDFQVERIFVELKNKHNTMNSSSSAKTYMRMQSKLIDDNDCACFLVEAIAKRSQDIEWKVTIDGEQQKRSRIRRVSLDKFYAYVTGQENSFYQMCMVLPIYNR